MKRVTTWYVKNKDGSWSFNHIEDGFARDLDRPHTNINDKVQEAAWANKKWKAMFAWMTKDGLVSEKAMLWSRKLGESIIPTEEIILKLEGK